MELDRISDGLSFEEKCPERCLGEFEAVVQVFSSDSTGIPALTFAYFFDGCEEHYLPLATVTAASVSVENDISSPSQTRIG